MINKTLYKYSNLIGGISSGIDSNVPKNIPLNQAAKQNELGDFGKSDKEYLINILQELLKLSPDQLRTIGETLLQKAVNRVTNNKELQPYVNRFNSILNAIRVTPIDNIRRRDPTTGRTLPTMRERIQKLLQELQYDNKFSNSNKTYNFARASAKSTKNTQITKQQYRKTQDEYEEKNKKKKSRGNPFKVLMGKVGKLLDHGMNKRDIVKYLSKVWDRENVERAVDIVKDYNRKLKRKRYYKKSFNLAKQTRLAQLNKAKVNNLNTGFTTWIPDYSKRSTTELIERYHWLRSVVGFNNNKFNEGRKAIDVNKAKTEINAILSELNRRGITRSEL